MTTDIRLGAHMIGSEHPCFLIAEAGVNHNGDLSLAKQLVAAASETGVDAIKFQTFQANKVASAQAEKAAYQLRTTNANESQIDMLQRLELTLEDFRELKTYCESMGLMFLSTPHDTQSIEVLEALDVEAFKIGSGDVTNTPFLEVVARCEKPLILSTGMCSLGDVELALDAIFRTGNRQVILLHCVSDYPAVIEDCNLRAMRTLAHSFHVPVGYSDHTIGDTVALAAVALGACVIEKHFTLDRSLSGPDHAASAEADELTQLVRRIRTVEASLGSGIKAPTSRELTNRDAIRKSLVADCDIAAGTTILRNMLTAKRPGTGLDPRCINEIIGKTARVAIAFDTLLHWGLLDD